MSKQKEEPRVGYGDGYLVFESTPECIVGKTLEIIEAIGLPTKQEVSVKNILKKNIYDIFGEQTIVVESNLNDLIRNTCHEKKYHSTDEVSYFGKMITLEDIN